MTHKPTRWLLIVIMAAMAIFLVGYLYMFFSNMIPFALSDPDQWHDGVWMDAGVVVPMSTRIVYFTMWAVPALASAVMIVVAMYLVNLMRRGFYFEHRTIRALQILGACAFFSGGGILVASAFTDWILTWHNTTNVAPIQFRYSSDEGGICLIGIGMFLLGWILQIAKSLRQENEEFV